MPRRMALRCAVVFVRAWGSLRVGFRVLGSRIWGSGSILGRCRAKTVQKNGRNGTEKRQNGTEKGAKRYRKRGSGTEKVQGRQRAQERAARRGAQKREHGAWGERLEIHFDSNVYFVLSLRFVDHGPLGPIHTNSKYLLIPTFILYSRLAWLIDGSLVRYTRTQNTF